MNSLPVPGPLLRASTVPSLQLDDSAHQCQPDPQALVAVFEREIGALDAYAAVTNDLSESCKIPMNMQVRFRRHKNQIYAGHDGGKNKK
jgi:hypothetical protein